MLTDERPYLVMGLLSRQSIAFAIGEAIRAHGGRVVYSVQSPVLKQRYLDRDFGPDAAQTLDLRYCDATREEEVRALFQELGSVAGVVHSLAYANPRTCLGPEFHTDAREDILRSYEVSCVSLALVARYAVAAMPTGGAVTALTFDAAHAYSGYNWMGIHKAALEALVRALARRHGRDGVRVNAVSAGPLQTAAAAKIPGFDCLIRHWQDYSPLPWNPVEDKAAVADAVVFLCSDMARRMTGQILMVDGGASIAGNALEPHERP